MMDKKLVTVNRHLTLKEAIKACEYMTGKQPFWKSLQWVLMTIDPHFVSENHNKIGSDS
jgi:hypothetical protein